MKERFKKEILDSQCFDRLRLKYKDHFDAYIADKLVIVEGDLVSMDSHS